MRKSSKSSSPILVHHVSWVQIRADPDHSKLLLFPAELERAASPLDAERATDDEWSDFSCDYDRQATLPWTWRRCKPLVTFRRCCDRIFQRSMCIPAGTTQTSAGLVPDRALSVTPPFARTH